MTVAGRLQDTLLAGAATGFAVLFLSAALAWELPQGPTVNTPIVARLTAAQGAVQVRASQRLGWRALDRGDDLRDKDSVFVAPGGAAKVSFADGTELDLDEKSLVVIEAPRAGTREVTVKQGSLSGTAGEAALLLVTAQGSAALAPKAEAHVELTGGTLGVAVTKGQAQVKSGAGTTTVGTGERAQANAAQGVSALPAWPVTLTSPKANDRHRALPTPEALQLAVEGQVPSKAKVELAKDRLFAFVVETLPLENNAARLERPAVGVTWWRVVDEAGLPVSESRRFSFIEEAPPQAMTPKEGEQVLAPVGQVISFSWTPLVGVTTYRLEISSLRGFEPIVASQTVQAPQLKWPSTLAEGSFYWRVTAVDGAVGEGLPSTPTKFRLIWKPLLMTPELLPSEVEIAP